MKSQSDDRAGQAMACPASCAGEFNRRAGWAPCRAADERRARSGDVVPLDPGLADSLAAQPIDLGRYLAEVGKVVFRTSGTCMYPSIRPGDILHVEPRPAAAIEAGEIAVVRRYGRFFAHRVVDRQADPQGPFIVTRPDRAFGGGDAPARDPDILGVVTDIERGGKIHKVQKVSAGKLHKFAAAPSLALVALGQTAIEGATGVALSLQQFAVYRKLAAAFFAATKSRYVVTVRLPLRPNLDTALSRLVKGDAVDRMDLRTGEGIPNSFTVALEDGGRAAATLSFFRRPETCPHAGWWLSAARVRVRCRGMGLAGILFAKAGEILARSGEPPARIDLALAAGDEGWLRRELGLPAPRKAAR